MPTPEPLLKRSSLTLKDIFPQAETIHEIVLSKIIGTIPEYHVPAAKIHVGKIHAIIHVHQEIKIHRKYSHGNFCFIKGGDFSETGLTEKIPEVFLIACAYIFLNVQRSRRLPYHQQYKY